MWPIPKLKAVPLIPPRDRMTKGEFRKLLHWATEGMKLIQEVDKDLRTLSEAVHLAEEARLNAMVKVPAKPISFPQRVPTQFLNQVQSKIVVPNRLPERFGRKVQPKVLRPELDPLDDPLCPESVKHYVRRMNRLANKVELPYNVGVNLKQQNCHFRAWLETKGRFLLREYEMEMKAQEPQDPHAKKKDPRDKPPKPVIIKPKRRIQSIRID